MHRALVIRLSEDLADAIDRVAREYAVRAEAGTNPALVARFMDAPPQGVGNLTNPVQVLRENLEGELLQNLTALLRMSPGAGRDFVLDVFVLLNLGEPLVANAASVVIDMVLDLVDGHFRAIFPAHRTGAQRRFRILPVALLPASADCRKAREDAIQELGALHDAFAERQRAREGREFPVDRFFLLDAVTGLGIAALDDLTAQTASFMRLALFSGLRRKVEFVQLLESECSDLFATFGVSCCEVDFEAVRETLTERMLVRAAEVLAEEGISVLPSVDELLPHAVLDDPVVRDRVLEELDSLPLRSLEVEGSIVIQPLRRAYYELLQRLAGWRTAYSEKPPTPKKAEPLPRKEASATFLAFVGACALGVIVFCVAHFALVVSAGTSAATGGAFAVLAFLLVLLFLPRREATAENKPAQPPSEEPPFEVIQVFEQIVRSKASQLMALQTALQGIAGAVDLDPEEDGEEEPERPQSMFRDDLVTDSLLHLLYVRRANDDDVRALADRFLLTLGTWEELLDGDVVPTSEGLDEFCREHFEALGGQPLFTDPDSRDCVAEVLSAFLDRWRKGVPSFLEGESRKQFDPDGFRTPFSSCVIGPAELAAEIGSCLRADDGVLNHWDAGSALDDVFVLTAVIDIHPDAVAPLADSRGERTA